MSRLPTLTRPNLQDALRGIAGMASRVRSWRARQQTSPAWAVTIGVIVAVVLLPVFTIVLLALAPEENIWPHLASTVLPRAFGQTVLLLLGAGCLTLVTGTATAWIVTMYRFPGRAIVDRALVIPLAVPTYIVAYCYAELLDYAGPLQTALRDAFGYTSANDYWFPHIRSLEGAVFVMASVLYPYVYLTARASFVQQSVCALEVARTLGRTPLGAFWSVALPTARPALAAGVALVAMECLNDIGAVQHLGVETLTASIYSTWLQRSNLGGAAQLAIVMLGLIVVLFAAERLARRGGRVHHTTGRYRSIPFEELDGWRGIAALLVCALPFLIGFGVPFIVLVQHAFSFARQAFDEAYVSAALNSLMLATQTALIAVGLALVLGYARRVAGTKFTNIGVRLAGLGYAIPGTVLALGLLFPLAAFDNGVDSIARSVFGFSTGLMLSGSLFAIVLACVIRFLAVSLGSIEAGLERISPNLDAASRALGETSLTTLTRVHLPLLMPAIGAACLLVFVDAMKELPATLLMRPFNFETLATQVYSYAGLEQFEEASLGALTIVLVGLIPVLALHQTVAGGRAGGTGR